LPDYDHDEVKAKLDARLQEIDALLGKIEVRGNEESGELADYDQHPGDQGTETFEQEMDESKRAILEDERSAVEQALQRLADGKYGYSVDSGEEIPAERLKAMPEAIRTVDEQRRYEAGNSSGPTGPGPAI
jgi:RNA polymerase-binding transcription factor DksA